VTSLLILTVGTGTAGKHSDVAQGLVNTIDHIRPRHFWLVPSVDPKSTPVADLICEGVAAPAAFQPWSETAPYHAIARHDDIHECRQQVREVIQAARQLLRQGERLIINPTSGTKQMSAGATLAALDEEVDQIDFTTGQRVDGVVKTGTEEIQSFNVRAFLLQRDLRTANELFAAGAFFAAARLLRGYSEIDAVQAREKARCLHEWQRLNHCKAASHAAKFDEDLRLHLKHLGEADEFSAERLGDLLASADELARWGDHEEALARYYRAAEQAAKVRLADAHALRPPYRLDGILNLLPAGSRLADDFRRKARMGRVLLTAQVAWDLLDAMQDPMAAAYFADHALQQGLSRRNETMYGHGQASVDATQSLLVASRLRNLLRDHLPAAATCWNTTRRPIHLF
jgi:Csm6 HEPN domain